MRPSVPAGPPNVWVRGVPRPALSRARSAKVSESVGFCSRAGELGRGPQARGGTRRHPCGTGRVATGSVGNCRKVSDFSRRGLERAPQARGAFREPIHGVHRASHDVVIKVGRHFRNGADGTAGAGGGIGANFHPSCGNSCLTILPLLFRLRHLLTRQEHSDVAVFRVEREIPVFTAHTF
jgi:hypothetical protein